MGSLPLGALLLLLATPVRQATVVGTVRDAESGDPIAGAVVTLTDLHRSAITGPDGRYTITRVPAGPQHLSVRFIGYASRTLHALVPGDGQLEIDIALRRAPVWLPSLEVHPPVSIRGGENDSTVPFPDRRSSIAAIGNHPLFTEPDALQAMGGGEVVLGPEAPSGVHIRGGEADQTYYLLDGIPVLSPYHTAAVFTAWNPDALSQLRLSSTGSDLADPAALAGSVEAATRTPEAYLRVQAGVSNTQARLTLDGPIAGTSAAFLLSGRTGLPNLVPVKRERTYILGGTSDRLAKVEVPWLGGHLGLLGYYSPNEINTAATLDDSSATPPPRNLFEWNSRSVGATWQREFSSLTVRILAWSARGEANSTWAAESARVQLDAYRADGGGTATLAHRSPHGSALAGVRVERISTSYQIASDSASVPPWSITATTPVLTLFGEV